MPVKPPLKQTPSKATRTSKVSKHHANTRTIRPTQKDFGFPIVGIGASAGGLEAFTRLLNHLSTETGMAFVLLQHLDPKHASLSADILSRATQMPVTEVKDGIRVEANHVYVIPPNFSMGILHGVLNLLPRTEAHGHQPLVIDTFFQSLAKDQRNLAVGVILSGTGSDGTQGLIAIKAEGGITFAQVPKSAKFESMPQSAIASGSIDLILSPEQIAEELIRIAHHPYVVKALPTAEEDEPPRYQDDLSHIFLILRNQCHVDFSLYKANTVKRRMERRMALNRVDNLKAYAEFLSTNPDEVKALYADILIHVTSFFRDPETFEVLKEKVFPNLMVNRAPGAPIRIWIPGCSTGEEPYSIAITLLEFLGEKHSHTPIQIFASDISEQAIQKARLGEYPDMISDNVSPERLARFFVKMDDGGFKISKGIRDLCLFSRHDITTDPPFAKLDLISCRNLLIYFTSALQKHVIPIFHYALVPHGFLWLGMSETIGESSDLFSLVDKANKIYARKDAPITINLRFPSSTYVHGKQADLPPRKSFSVGPLDVQKITEQALQAEYPGVLVNEGMEILQVRGRTVPFIELPAGVPSYHLFRMVHPELVRDLQMTLEAAKKLNGTVRQDGLSVGEGRHCQLFNLKVIPIQPASNSKARLYLILFEKTLEVKSKIVKALERSGRKGHKAGTKKDPYVLELQQELKTSQEYQHSLVQKFESAQEDLTTANEELQSANEELQSTNEELETAKEELQSGNEELTTVNDELQFRSVEQFQANNDLTNLLGSVEIPIVMLSDDRRIRRFTPLAGKALNLISTDVGRPLSDLKLNFSAPGVELNLEEMVSRTIETMNSQEIEVQDRRGHWFRLQVRPYKTIDNRIDGAVLALVDINSLKVSLKEVRDARSEAEKANRAKDLFLATLSHELRTPLTAMLSWAQMLRSGKLDDEKIKRAAEIIEESGKIQAQLINDLLDVSRIIAGKVSLEKSEMDPGLAVRAAIEAVRPSAELRSIEFETFFSPHVGTVMADPLRLQQVFWNLLTNAVKFSVPGSKVSVRMERINVDGGEKAKAMIQVSDSGKGIDAEFLPQIFDRFSQEDSSSIRIQGGLGLGLAIVRNLVEMHEGSIRAESLGTTRGATFTVLLPIKSDQDLKEGRSIADSSLRVGGAPVRLDRIRVLVVDDEANTREAVAELLRSFGADVRVAGSAEEALKCFQLFQLDVLVSDIAMPGEDGYSLIRRVRALGDEKSRNTPALAMTAFAGGEASVQAISAGFQAHLSKPFDGKDLAKAIFKLVGKS